MKAGSLIGVLIAAFIAAVGVWLLLSAGFNTRIDTDDEILVVFSGPAAEEVESEGVSAEGIIEQDDDYDAVLTYEGVYLTHQDRVMELVNDSGSKIYFYHGCAEIPELYILDESGRTRVSSGFTCLAVPDELSLKPGQSIEIDVPTYQMYEWNEYHYSYEFWLDGSMGGQMYYALTETLSGEEAR